MNYAIGDIQGCVTPLKKLLERIRFNPEHDILWFTGDLVNRGPKSLETLRFIKSLGDQHPTVLGNHDLHLLAVASLAQRMTPEDTFTDILNAPDKNELIDWLSKKPLLYHDDVSGFTMVHAGLAPSWDLTTAKRLAKEVETVIQSPAAFDFFQHMYGDHPDHWNETLQGTSRLRCITNYFTRVRFCHPDGRIELKNKGQINPANKELMPWFKVPHRVNAHLKIIFGHWAALGGVTDTPNTYALDTGCVWGNKLTAMRLEDEKRYEVSCK